MFFFFILSKHCGKLLVFPVCSVLNINYHIRTKSSLASPSTLPNTRNIRYTLVIVVNIFSGLLLCQAPMLSTWHTLDLLISTTAFSGSISILQIGNLRLLECSVFAQNLTARKRSSDSAPLITLQSGLQHCAKTGHIRKQNTLDFVSPGSHLSSSKIPCCKNRCRVLPVSLSKGISWTE